MTNSDQLMLAAVKAQVPFRINDREVTVDEDNTAVRLYDEQIMTLSRAEGNVTVSGCTRVTHKSARVFNTILREFTDFEMVSRDGQWILQGRMGEPMPVDRIGVIVPIRKEFR